MSNTTSAKSLYRSFLKSYTTPKGSRSATVQQQARAMAQSLPQKDAANLQTFFQAGKLHKDLIALYNPTSTMSQEEKTRATARVVGLDVPLDLDQSKPVREGTKLFKEEQ